MTEEERMQVEVETGLKNFQITMKEIAKARADERVKVIEEVRGCLVECVTGGWTTKENSHKVMDTELAQAIIDKLRAKLEEMGWEK